MVHASRELILINQPSLFLQFDTLISSVFASPYIYPSLLLQNSILSNISCTASPIHIIHIMTYIYTHTYKIIKTSRGYKWPIENFVPDTPGWDRIMRRRFDQVRVIVAYD